MRVKTIVIIFCFLVSICGAAAGSGQYDRITGSGILTTKQFNYRNFTKIHAGSAFEVTITKARNYSIKITADRNVMDLVEVTKLPNRLDLKVKPNFSFRRITLKAQITMPDIKSIDLSGAAKAELIDFQLKHDLHVDMSGASELRADISIGDLTAALAGASTLQLEGTAGNIVVDGGGSSTLDLENLAARDADINLQGASTATIHPSGRLQCRLSGASKLYYVGDVRVNLSDIKLSGASKIERID